MANIGKGAASGAAIGSAISPGLGTVIGGIGLYDANGALVIVLEK